MPTNDELARRVKAADEDNQRELLWEAWHAINDGDLSGSDQQRADFFIRHARFGSMIDAKAYESAAMTLVPEGCLHMVRTLWDEGKTAGNAVVHRYRFEGDAIFWVSDHSAVAATPALALVAAALKAHTESAGDE